MLTTLSSQWAASAVFGINPASFPGGIALWGALPPVYDTTQMEIERGVHVHARKIPLKRKEIDSSYAVVEVQIGEKAVSISENAAVAYVAAAILGLPLKYIECPHCNSPHLDVENYALDPHQKHLCHNCEQLFEDADRAIGNPIVLAKQLLNDSTVERPTKKVGRRIDIDQRDPTYSGGIRLWGTHPAILWTAEREEEEGIHVHAYHAGEQHATVDQTYGAVSIDGIELDPRAVRSFMVQQQAPRVREKLARVLCCGCSKPLVEDKAPKAITPSTEHSCDCGRVTTTGEPVIANEMPAVLAQLYQNAKFAGLSKNVSLT
jgi:hypothetical protein